MGVNRNIGILIMEWFWKLCNETCMSGTSFPVITISAYATILDVVMKNFDTGCINIIE